MNPHFGLFLYLLLVMELACSSLKNQPNNQKEIFRFISIGYKHAVKLGDNVEKHKDYLKKINEHQYNIIDSEIGGAISIFIETDDHKKIVKFVFNYNKNV